MASPSGTSGKEGVKCDGIIKKGARKGQRCGKMLLKKDSPQEDPSIACPSPNSYCGKHKSFLALLSEAVDIWGEPLRKKMLAVLTEKNQEKRSQKMKDMEIKQKRTVVATVGLESETLLDVKGELLPFTKGEKISYANHYGEGLPHKKNFEVKEVNTHWDTYWHVEKKEIFIERWVYLEEVK